MTGDERAMRRTVRLAAILNLAYFGAEFAVALAIRERICQRTSGY